MKLIQIMKRGPDKELSTESWTSATMDPDTKKAKTIRIWFQSPNPDYFGSSRYRVEMDRADAMRLRDNLNHLFPETDFYEDTETLGTVLNRRKNLS